MAFARHNLHPSILREYDIRGIVGRTLNRTDAVAVGRAFAAVVRDRCGTMRICVGRDGRSSSPDLEAAVVEGILATGAQATRIGCGPTPMLYFAGHKLEADAAIMITGSHNPPDHNGFKMMVGHKPFFGDMIRELGRISANGDWPAGHGRMEEIDVSDDYVSRLLQGLGAIDVSPLGVGWDAGNGAAGEILQRLTRRLPGRHVLLNEVIDGRFPAHHPDPTEPDNLTQLRRAVVEQRLDLGIAFDGDGDRIGAVDGQGRIIWGDQLLIILARDVLKSQPGATIIADVKASQALFDEVTRLGGQPLMWKTGHSLIKAKMAATGAPLAGEMSGHIFFADDYYGFDDALFAAIRLLRAIVLAGRSVEQLRNELPTLSNTPEIRIGCPDDLKFQVVANMRDQLRLEGVAFNDIDGVRLTTNLGWWLLRASNTQAVLVARAEARNSEDLAVLITDLINRLCRLGVALPAVLPGIDELRAAAGP
jgi:phosphomannomutase